MEKINILLFCGIILGDLFSVTAQLSCHNEGGYQICVRQENLISVEEKNCSLIQGRSLKLSDPSISIIVPGAFKHLNVTMLTLNFTQTMYGLKPNSFSGLPVLESLTIISGTVPMKNNLFGELKNSLRFLRLMINGTERSLKEALPELSKLENLTFVNSNLHHISSDTFFNYRLTLVDLNLSYNKIVSIASRAFESLGNLRNLNLNFNHLSTLGLEAFNGLYKLETFSIASNELEKIQKDVFGKLKRLRILDLKNNGIKDIEAQAFYGMIMTNLSLDNNQLSHLKTKTFDGLARLKMLTLDHNKIEMIEFAAFQGLELETLSLRFNKLTQITYGSFIGLAAEKIDLSNNFIDSIHPSSFKFTATKSIHLNTNVTIETAHGRIVTFTRLQKIDYKTHPTLKNK